MGGVKMSTDASLEAVPAEELRKVLRQTSIPILIRRGKGYPLLVRLPYDLLNRGWLSISGRRNPDWDDVRKQWEVPLRWFPDLLKRSLAKFGRVYVVQPYQEQERCAPACWDAEGDECQCSCMGMNHGSRSPAGQWRIVSDAFATRWGERELACRLITAKE